MMERDDVARATEGADAAFLITPIGANNSSEPEVRAAAAAIAGVRASGSAHLIYASQILPKEPTGVAILDAKVEIEAMLAGSGLSWSSLCVGCYMDEWLGMAPGLLRAGILLNPISASRPLSFTCKKDMAQLAVKLTERGQAINGPLDVVEPTPHTLGDAAELIGQSLGRKVRASGSRPLLPLMRMAQGPLRRFKPVMVSKIILGTYFDQYGYVGDTTQMASVLPWFQVTDLDTYVREAFGGVGSTESKHTATPLA